MWRRSVVRFMLVTLVGLAAPGMPQDLAWAAPALDGEGTLAVAPPSVDYGSAGNSLTFTFTANIGDFSGGSQLEITVPPGWAAPTLGGGAGMVTVSPGTCTLQGSPPHAVVGATILVDIASCLAGQWFTVTYAGVPAPAVSGSPYTFAARTDIGAGGGGLVPLTAGSPAVTVVPASLTVSAGGLLPADKTYDGTTAAALTIGVPTLVGVLGADVVTLDTTAATGIFADRNAGNAKPVTIAGLALAGADAGGYTLVPPVRSASILQRPLTVSAVTDTKGYDGTTASTGSPVLSASTPLAPGDPAPAWTQSFDSAAVGTGKILTPRGVVDDGNGGLNYAYTFVSDTTGVITGRPITVTAVPDSKVYDGTTASSGLPLLSAATPLAPGDVAPAWTQTFDSRNAGAGKTLVPAGAVNDGNGGLNYLYTFVPDTSGIVTPRPITVIAVTETKVYDGTTGSAGVPLVSATTPLAPGDTAPVWTQRFDSIHVGTGKTITAAGAVDDGNGGANYAYTFLPDTTGSVTARPVTIEADAKVKWLGSPDPPLTFRVTAGSLVSGDTVVLTRVAGEALGAYPISIGFFPARADYGLTFAGANLTISTMRQFAPLPAQDGWVLESTRTSGVGGWVDARSPVFRLGDDAAGRQYRAILSFNTASLPDTAVISSVVLQVKRTGTLTGTNPFGVLGKLLIDVRTGSFGASALTPSDFQATASAAGVGTIGTLPVGGWYQGGLSAAGLGKINKRGITQLRLRFAKGDNGNRAADFVKCASGNALKGQPRLTITYSLP